MNANVAGLRIFLHMHRSFLFVLGGLALIVGILYFVLFAGLPDGEEIKSYRPETTVVNGEVDWNLRPESPIRIWVPLTQISPLLQKAVVISEDDLFYQHNGVNFGAVKEAFKINWQKKSYVRGASTITMQLARNAFLHKRKTLLRKIREIILAKRIEEHISKTRIIESYLNIVEWGENIYGAEAAARYYFGKTAEHLNLSEATMLAGMLPNPKYFNPYKRPESCQRMQKRVLWLMEIAREITADQALSAQTLASSLRGQTSLDETVPTDSVEEAKYGIEITDDSIPPFHPAVISFEDSIAQQDSLVASDSVETKASEKEFVQPSFKGNSGGKQR